MINSKQRAYLKSLANKIDTSVFIGKSGVTDNVITSIEQALDSNELAKVTIQEGAGLDPRSVCNEIAEKIKAEPVQSIGRKFVLYREAKDEKNRKIRL